ncbi:DUF4214 domain-containing protein [Chelatococcus asaccharovorans]|uniref:Uncharacterized protein DUF4214 n=1 Tax=Chelatococcus asaccharovorans TaxID=28210 RepID=A0A2V3TS51_9HYPH|nr:DUF4214 domain-containing protein [Chelatococcus asaccharovorans]MBS7703109.1 DUF4214 domain-containing protein [Chelatococcus asaccharovorans]PXW50732.1 uncharacterized protein DUF4214 [Chelatococcus asaccharovorans]
MTLPADIVIPRYEGILRSTPSEAQLANYTDFDTVVELDNALLSAAVVTVDPVVRLYQAVFGRVPDSDGLDFWVAAFDGGQGMSLLELSSAFGDSGEFESQYGGLTNSQIVGRIYSNVLGRPGDQAGIAFWTEVLNNGGSIAEVIVGFSQSPEFVTSTEAYVEGFLLAAADGEGIYTGSLFDVLTTTYDLTVNADHIVGTGSSEIFSAPLATGLDGLFATQTLQGVDVLDGGDGHDILKAELNGFTGIGGSDDPSIKNIEEFQLTSRDNDAELDMTRVEGVEEIRNVNSTRDLDVYEIQNSVVLAMDNVSENTTFYASYAADALGSDHASQVVEINSVGKDADNRTELNVHANGADVITDLALTVTGDNYLQVNYGLHGTVEHLTIDGDGDLNVRGNWFQQQWDSLKTLDASEMTGDLDIDVRGSTTIESIETGSGNDRVVVNGANFDGADILIDLGAGDNQFALAKVYDDGDIDALDFTGTTLEGFDGVLEFVDNVSLGGDATLDLSGIGEQVTTLDFVDIDGNGNELMLAGTADALTVDVEFEINDLELHAGSVADLTVVAGDRIDLDQVTGSELKSLNLATTEDNSDIWLDIDAAVDPLDSTRNVAALETINVDATAGVNSDASVEIDASGATDDIDSLKTIDVRASGNAELNLTGRAGVVEVLGVHQVEQFTMSVTGAGGNFPLFNPSTAAGEVTFASGSLDAGVVLTDYSSTLGWPFNQNGNVLHDVEAASDIAADLDALAELNASSSGNVVTVEWADFGPQTGLTVFAPGTGATSGSLVDPVVSIVTPGVTPVSMEPGSGFDALETVTLVAGADADANLEDVYGDFVLDVSAGNNANVDLFNTEAVSATISAGNSAVVDVSGDTIGNWSLETLTVSAGNSATVDLSDNLASFTTLDVSQVGTNLTGLTTLTVDASDALYGATAVTYVLGATDTITFDAEAAGATREIFTFDGAGIDLITINDFEGGNTVDSDRIDLSAFGVTSAGELSFVDNGGNLEITSITGAFAGEITLVGLGADANDVSQFNIIYA